MRKLPAWVVWGMVPGLVGCATAPPTPSQSPATPAEVAKARDDFESVQDRLQRLDREGVWTEAVCRKTGSSFAEIGARLARSKPEASRAARYNQGVALMRCRLRAEARAVFEGLVADAPDFHPARVQLAVIRYAERGAPFLTEAVAELERAVADSRFGSAEALVQLAILELERRNGSPDADGADDFERARKNLRRALAVDDGYMPAYNQLAIYYLEDAKRKAGRERSTHLRVSGDTQARADTAALELAALVCSQAVRKQPGYAPIHNTAGLISAELGQLAAAAKSFARARQLDPLLVEAHMNYAAVNLQFRGFERAEEAYRRVLKLRPEDYEAHLGLALALRGRIGQSSEGMKLLTEAEKELRTAKALQPSRPEAYFNEAILVQEFHARGGGPETAPMLRKARELFATFIDKAKDKPELKSAIARAAERMRDIDQVLGFLGGSP